MDQCISTVLNVSILIISTTVAVLILAAMTLTILILPTTVAVMTIGIYDTVCNCIDNIDNVSNSCS